MVWVKACHCDSKAKQSLYVKSCRTLGFEKKACLSGIRSNYFVNRREIAALHFVTLAMTKARCHCELKAKQSRVRCAAKLFALKSHEGLYRLRNLSFVMENETASCLAVTNAEIASSRLQGRASTNVNAVMRSRWL